MSDGQNATPGWPAGREPREGTLATPPAFGPADAARLARELYGLTCEAEGLPSERDRNFALSCGAGGKYVLKLFNAREEPGLVKLQAETMSFIAALDEPAVASVVPAPVRSVGGRTVTWVTAPSGTARHAAMLVPFMPGTLLANVRRPSPALQRDVGTVLGAVDAALAAQPQPGPRRGFQWAAQTAQAVIGRHLPSLRVARRGLVEEIVADFRANAGVRLPDLRQSLIHNDANDHNLLVDGDRVTGLLDFGDMLVSFTVCELAHALAYLLQAEGDPLDVAFEVTAGYQARYPLTRTELASVYDFVRLRLALSVTLSAHQAPMRPGDGYLTVSEEPAWWLIERFAGGEPSRRGFTEAVLAGAAAAGSPGGNEP